MSSTPKRILIVDDEPSIVQLLTDILEEEGFKTFSVDNADDALEKIKQSPPDLIVLDVGLPTVGGFDLCRIIKTDNKTRLIPIIMLTVRSSERDKVTGLEMGADDYITKPFGKKELVARVRAAIRRAEYPVKKEKILKCGDITIDLEGRTVYRKKKLVSLRPKEFDILCLLMEKKGKVANRNFLAESVLGYGYIGSTRTIDVHIKNLRKSLGQSGKKIQTIAGIGYKIID